MIERVIELGKSIAFKHTKLGAPGYAYCIDPIQLATFIQEIERLKHISGSIVEIGVARGMTTKFICEHIKREGYRDRYVALDTFNSFVDEDVEFEVKRRNKDRDALRGFAYNDYEAWKRNLAEYRFLSAIQADCSKFDFGSIAPIKIAFLDVDLYLPTKNALPGIMNALVPGGVIIIDDVAPNTRYDGAYQAYMEFCQDQATEPELVGQRCGVIRKKVV